MARSYYSHADPARETLPWYNSYRDARSIVNNQVSNNARKLHPGGVPRTRYRESRYHSRARGAVINDRCYCLHGLKQRTASPTCFCGGSKQKKQSIMTRDVNSQQTKRVVQNGPKESKVSNKKHVEGTSPQPGSRGDRVYSRSKRSCTNNNIRENESVHLAPHVDGKYINRGCDEYAKDGANVDKRVIANDSVGECEQLERNCLLCEKDLSYMWLDEIYIDDDEDRRITAPFRLPEVSVPSRLPEVAVLPCGHAFHNECLMQCPDYEQSTEPPCFLCIT